MEVCEVKHISKVYERKFGLHTNIKSVDHPDKAGFRVNYCPNCNKAWEEWSTKGGYNGLLHRTPKVEYYEGFPAIGCKKEICPNCKQKELK
jgi:hypothetical protein